MASTPATFTSPVSTAAFAHDGPHEHLIYKQANSVVAEEVAWRRAFASSMLCVTAMIVIEQLHHRKIITDPQAAIFGRLIFKGAASASFLVAAGNLAAASPDVTFSDLVLLVAMVLCALGDVFLVLAKTVVLGIAAFGLGHVAFMLAFATAAWMSVASSPLSLYLAGIATVTINAPLLAFVVVKIWPAVPANYATPVKIYSIVLFCMAVLAAASGEPDNFIAAMLFVASDVGIVLRIRPSVYVYYSAMMIFAHTISHRSLFSDLAFTATHAVNEAEAINSTTPPLSAMSAAV